METKTSAAAALSKSIDAMMTDEERHAVVMSVMKARAPEAVLEDDLIAALDWARGVQIDQLLLKLVIDGKIVMDISAGQEPKFRAIK